MWPRRFPGDARPGAPQAVAVPFFHPQVAGGCVAQPPLRYLFSFCSFSPLRIVFSTSEREDGARRARWPALNFSLDLSIVLLVELVYAFLRSPVSDSRG